MNRNREIIQWFIVGLLVIATLNFSPFFSGNITSDGAFRASEQGRYYGPSEVIHVVDYGDIKIYLARYNSWISADGVRREFFQWFPTANTTPLRIDSRVHLNYSSFITESVDKNIQVVRLFGHINENSIKKVQLIVLNGNNADESIILESQPLENLFIFHWDQKQTPYTPTKILGWDADNQVIFQTEIEWAW